MTRIPYPSIDDLSILKRERIFDPARKYLLNVTRMTLHLPDGLWLAQAMLGRATIVDATIDKRLKEMIIIRVGHLQNSDYELFHHRSIGMLVGVTPDEMAALEGGDLDLLPANERAMIDFVTELVRHPAATDRCLAAARVHFSDQVIFEITAIVGYYMMVARFIAVGGVEPDPSPVTTW